MKNVNLYIQTEYSLLNSTLHINKLIKSAIDKGYKALAITDINNMHGAIKFYEECTANGIKPIMGLSLVLGDNRFLLYAMNNNGYRNLLKITSIMNYDLENTKSLDDFKNYFDDLICILPGTENELVRDVIEGKDYSDLVISYKKYFKELYLGLDFQSLDMKEFFVSLLDFSMEYGIKGVSLNKTLYNEKEDYEVYEILKCVELGLKKYLPSEKERNAKFLSFATFNDSFRSYPFLIDNLEQVESKCSVTLEFGKYRMPKYETIDNKDIDTNSYLHDLGLYGLKKRLVDNSVLKKDYQKYIDRFEYEVAIISKMGFSDYFLVVYDFIKYAKKKGILVGPGRGSGPGSLVAYSLGITEIDPIKFGLLFERFLNPERVSMPDIDTDFPDDRRDEVFTYMAERYGKDRVAHIATFGTYGPRSAIRDIARVKEIDEFYIEEILKQLPTLTSADQDDLALHLNSIPILKRMYDEKEIVKYVIDLALKMENLPRNLSIHAAGIIMADRELDYYTPLSKGSDDLYQTQFDAHDLEKIGLVKIDFLGLRNLTMIDKIIKLIGDKDFNINKIPLDNKDVYAMLNRGDTSGIFQLESSGMTKTIMQLKCSKFEDIVDSLALYRPGPMEMIPSFARRKQGLEKVTYIHPDLEEILKPTYGAIVYQEQIMQIASKFSGFSLGEADVLRRAISKKKIELIESMHDKFVSGAIKNGYSEDIAKSVFELIKKFADYGFNKSHSVSYGMISYQMAYLKTMYFKEFISVCLSYNLGNIRSIKNYIFEANKRGIKVLAPNINKSSCEFVLDDNKIYYSLLGINGLGEVLASAIVKEREARGLYKSYDDFIARTKNFLTRKNVESLIYAGAFDLFKIPRKELVLEYDTSLKLASFGGIFEGELTKHEFNDDEFGFEDISNYERSALGFNIKYDIFKRYSEVRDKYKAPLIKDVTPGSKVNLMFVLDSIRKIKTKKGEEMAFLSLTDESGTIDAVTFPLLYSECKDYLAIGKIYLAACKIEKRDEKYQAVIDKFYRKK